jgi:hypothetical protein
LSALPYRSIYFAISENPKILSSGRKQLTGFVGRSIRQLIVLAWRSRGARSMRDARARGLSTHDQSDDVHSRQDEDAPEFSERRTGNKVT